MRTCRKVSVFLAITASTMTFVSFSSAETLKYTYDAMGRLTQASYADGKVFRYSYDKMGNRYQETARCATGKTPGAPTNVSVTARDAQARVSFNAPVSRGGSPIRSYRVISDPGGRAASGRSSPITVTGLTNGTAYTFTVTATNAVCTGPQSRRSTRVTPRATTGSISGYVFSTTGTGIAGVTITLGGALSRKSTTDADGNFAFNAIKNGNYTLKPSKSGYTFMPASRAVTVNGAPVTDQGFVGFR